jgi:hypothetical protein
MIISLILNSRNTKMIRQGVRNTMKYGGFILSIVAAMIIVLLANIKHAYSQPVASGSAGLLLFVFIWFICFVIPRIEK